MNTPTMEHSLARLELIYEALEEKYKDRDIWVWNDIRDVLLHRIGKLKNKLDLQKNGKPFFAIVMEGGLVQGVFSNSKQLEGLEYIIIDYDVGDTDDDAVPIDQGNGTSELACVWQGIISAPVIDLKEVRTYLNKGDLHVQQNQIPQLP
jgi:hypothetical protein